MPTVTPEDNPRWKPQKFYDSLDAAFQNGDANTSLTIFHPRIVQVEGLAAGTDIKVQGKVHKDAAWVVLSTLTGGAGDLANQSYEFDPRYNMVRVTRTGAANVIAYAQLS